MIEFVHFMNSIYSVASLLLHPGGLAPTMPGSVRYAAGEERSLVRSAVGCGLGDAATRVRGLMLTLEGLLGSGRNDSTRLACRPVSICRIVFCVFRTACM